MRSDELFSLALAHTTRSYWFIIGLGKSQRHNDYDYDYHDNVAAAADSNMYNNGWIHFYGAAAVAAGWCAAGVENAYLKRPHIS